jgi:sigma-B regulation protein RsbQ
MRWEQGMQTDVILLPGLHGSTALFRRFVALAPSWARCLPVALPAQDDQSFDSLAAHLESTLLPFEDFVLFAESFAGPVAARLAERLGAKVALLVLCNPLVESPVPIVPFFAAHLVQSRVIPVSLVAHLMTGGDRMLAKDVVQEIRLLPKKLLRDRLAVACAAGKEDLDGRLSAPILGIVGSEDRLVRPARFQKVLSRISHSAHVSIAAPHLAAQVAPAAVWSAISAELDRAR